MDVRGVITDWGGVLTNPIAETVNAWLAADGIDRDRYMTVMRQWVSQAYDPQADDNPIHALERGESSLTEFEMALASELVLVDGGPVAGEGLLSRMWAATKLDDTMLEVFRRLHDLGVPTGLLSNSWGNGYPRELFAERFDAVVISCEVGMRKPESRIFLHAAELLGLEPAECVFIDDIAANITAAEQLGFTGVLHTDTATTRQRLSELLGIDL
ncbi:MAG TPA: HAD family phosphatase [Streptosporangiaceae bacterium]|nr:HAD family phosphatase [Streptosporangiaceae bacterium]